MTNRLLNAFNLILDEHPTQFTLTMAKLFLLFALFLLSSSFGKQIDYDYKTVLGHSIWFYEAQRSGELPPNNRVPWRGPTFLDDGAQVGLDLSGGYFDAGDHVKFGFPLAASMSVIGWGLLDYRTGYQAANQHSSGLETLRWGLDYMIKTHPWPTVIWANVGDGDIDHSFWGRPEEFPSTLARPCLQINATHPGSDLAGEYAAAFAVGSLVYTDLDPVYASDLLQHARDSYSFATQFKARYNDSIGDSYYGSWDYNDELLWASVWMYRATGEAQYLLDAKQLWDDNYMGWTPHQFGWDSKLAGAQILLAKLDGANHPEYVTAATNFANYMIHNATRTPQGLIFLQEWGSLRSIATVAFALLQAADIGIYPVENRALAKSQIDYILGSTGRSFVVGWGINPPQRPHHRAASCPDLPEICDPGTAANSPDPNPQVLFGALVGGPDANDFYEDIRQDYVKNEVALDYNAGFQSALAGLIQLSEKGLL